MKLAASAKGTSLGNFQLNFPTLPHTFLRAMELSRDVESINLDEVVKVVQNDLGAVTRILRVVNSAYYGVRSEINSIRRAVVVLGPEAVLGIVMSMSLVDLRSNLNVTTAVPFLNLVRHSIATGFIARHLSSKASLPTSSARDKQELLNEAFTAGLLHDFGKIVLLHNFPDEAAVLYESPMDPLISDEEILEKERQVFGFSHAETGGFLMNQLNFPPAISAIVERHHDLEDVSELPMSIRALLYIIVMSNRLANTMGYDFNHKITEQVFAEEPVLDRLIEEGVFDMGSKVILIEEALALQPVVDEYLNEVT
ncbi:MAG: HDOD domain-containing protein [Bacteroidota bacterium]